MFDTNVFGDIGLKIYLFLPQQYELIHYFPGPKKRMQRE